MLEWLNSVFVEPSILQTIIVVSLCAGLGLLLAKIRIGKISFGITFVFFVGIVLSYLGLRGDRDILVFIQNAGLVLFIYSLGVEVGPSFFPALKKDGLIFTIYSVIIIIADLLLVILFYYIFHIKMPDLLGLMAGAVTNTPVLAAVQSALSVAGLTDPEIMSRVASACAVCYPLGVVGVIFTLIVLNNIKNPKKNNDDGDDEKPLISELEITNADIDNKTIHDVMLLSGAHFIISRIWRGGKYITPKTDTVLHLNDFLLIISNKEVIGNLKSTFGKLHTEHDWNKPDIDWNSLDVDMESRRIIVTNSKINGVKLGSLRMRNKFGINVTRIDRAGIQLIASPNLYLQMGDRLTVVGDKAAIAQASKLLGDSVEILEKPRLVGFFFGMLLGCVVGLIPLSIPGLDVTVKLGIAGGPVLVGILMGVYGPRFKIVTYMSNSTTQALKQMGVVSYFAALGLNSGESFFKMLLCGDGVLWLVLGIIITILPTLLLGLLYVKIGKHSVGQIIGMLCGTMANPMALDYAQTVRPSRSIAVSYAAVYPVAMVIRIITAQLLLMFFM